MRVSLPYKMKPDSYTESCAVNVFVMIGLYAGLRREEILALQWDSVLSLIHI